MLGPDQGYDGMYGQGPPSVHSSHGYKHFQQQQGKLIFSLDQLHSDTNKIILSNKC